MNEDSMKKLYEVGYLLTPLIPEDKIADEVNALRSCIEGSNGFIVGEDQPKMRHLSYLIKQKGIASKKLHFEEAYFGWIRFHAAPRDVLSVKEILDKNDRVLRFILIKPIKDTSRMQRVVALAKPKLDAIKKEKRTMLSDQELDKEIDQLLDDNKISA